MPVIADYELIHKIGHGSYGDVWLARGLTGVYRAIKVVWRDRFTSAEPFEREFMGLKKFSAMSLPEASQMALLHVGQNEAAGFFYYVMELADDVATGRVVDPAKYAPLTLKEVRLRRGRLPAVECVNYGVELARSLAGLHERGLVHRDIKPSNIILVGGVPKLADIGLVASTADALTYVGTAGFVPPEGPGKPSADVFALGRLLYELATGLDRDEFPRLPQELAKVPDRNLLFALNDIILRCCEPMPEQRYADAAALLSDLEALRAGRRARRAPGALLATAAAAVVVAVGAGVFLLARKSPAPAAPVPVATAAPAAAPISEKAIAVLPFANLSGDKTQEYFSDGLSEELLNTLAKIPGLKVSGRTSAFSFKGRSVPASEIARQLGVAYVLDGSVRRSGDRVRIAAQLIKAADDSQVWTENFERDAKDIFAVQDEVAAKVAENLRVKFSGRPAPVAINTEAFALYLQGRQAWNERTPAALARAEELFNRTLALEPKFARAHVGLADVALAKALLDPGLHLPTFTRRDAPEFAAIAAQIERALALDPNLAEAHTSLGGVLIFGWRIADAQRELRLAVTLNPNYGTAHQWLGRALIADGRIEEGLAELKLAAGVDPLASRILDNYAYGLELAGRYSEALAVIDRALAVSPGAWQATEGKIRILLRLRRDEEARAIVRRIDEAAPRRYGDIPVYLIARAGLREEAARIFQPSPDGAYDAIHLLALGRQDEALASLTPDRTNAVILDSILFDPDYDPLRGNPRFTEYIAELSLADAYARAQAWRAAHPPESAAPKVTAAPLPAVETAADKSLVVLPLENLSPDPENAFFTDGLHTEIITTLSRLPDLKVTSRGTARGFKGVATPLAEIGQRLGVANILSGSVRREGRSVRVQLELRRASDEAVLWQKAFNREMQPGFALQDEIGADVARILQARTDAGWYSGAKFMTKNPEAYDLFLKARELPFLRGPSLETFVEEGRLAEEALRLDPEFMSAASLLSSAHSFASVNEPDPAKQKEHAAKAKRWGERAAELVPGGAGDGALAVYYRMVERDAARALPFAENEVRALPNDANGHNRVGASLADFGRVQESLAAYDRALALDPLNVRVLHNRVISFALLRRGPEFEGAAARSLEMGGKNVDPNMIDDFRFRLTGELPRAIEELDATVPERQLLLWYGRRFAELLAASDRTVAQFAVLSPYSRWLFFRLRAGACRQLGRAELLASIAREALTYAETLAPVSGADPAEYDRLRMWALAFADQRDAGLIAGRRYVEAASGPGRVSDRLEREHELAQIYAWFGRKKECVEILTRLIRLPTLITVPYLKLAPDWDNVRDDPGFQALLADPRNSKPL